MSREEQLEIGMRGYEGPRDVGREAQLREHRLCGGHEPWGGHDGRAERQHVSLIDVVEAGVVVSHVKHTEPPAGEERPRDNPAEMGSHDAHVVDPLG